MTTVLTDKKELSRGHRHIADGYVSKSTAINISIGLMLFSCVLMSGFAFSAHLSLAFMLIFYLLLFASYSIVYLKYLHFIFGSSIAIIGCAVIELFDMELIELSDYSSFQGSLPLLAFSWWLLLTVVTVHDSWLSKKLENKNCCRLIHMCDIFGEKDRKTGLIMYGAACVGCFLIVFTFIIVYKNPSFKFGLDRFKYAEQFDYGLLYNQANRFIRYLLIPCIVVAIYKKSKIGWIALAVYCAHSFWTGNKFGSFFSLLCTFLIIYSKKIEPFIEKNRKFIISIVLFMAVLIGGAVFAVSFTRDEGAENYLLPRLAQQGQLWWKTYDKSDTYHFSEFGDEIASIKKGTVDIKDNVGAKYGIYKIMYYTAPKTQVDAKLNSGSRYTEAGFASAYYYLGLPGCVIFAVLGGVLASTFVNYFLYFLRYNQFIRAFIHLRLFTNLAVFMSMFIFFPYFNKTSILSYIILLFGSNIFFKYGNEQI